MTTAAGIPGAAAAAGRTTTTARLAVVGTGIAGLYGALLAADAGMAVTVLSKGALETGNTRYAQGGICAVLAPGAAAPGDTVAGHVADTLRAGAGLCGEEAVSALCAEAAGDIASLERLGVRFDRGADGRRSLGLEGAHSAPRILHAGGDATGAVISAALTAAVVRYADAGLITLLTGARMTDLRCVRGSRGRPGGNRRRVAGVAYERDGVPALLDADAVLLATGGAGRLFEHSTNPESATGDGFAAAWRAGAAVGDAEFFQFHPTALAVAGIFMISEAVRGEGAVLRDAEGYRFMPDYHPDADLASRDVVSRSIGAHLAALGAEPEATVYLDATGIEAARGTGFLARRFPGLAAATAALGFDWTREWLPVIPAAHYWMGGVATDLHGRTSLAGLYAAGEVACTGVHGANRLASNSLLEGLVFGRRAVSAAARDTAGHAAQAPATPDFGAMPLQLPDGPGADFTRAELQRTMARCAAVVRDEASLAVAAKQLASWRANAGERENLRLAASVLVHAAAARTNSVGAHYRSDHTEHPAGRDRAFWINATPTSESDIP